MEVIGFLLLSSTSLMCLSVTDVRELIVSGYTFRSCPASFGAINHLSNPTCL